MEASTGKWGRERYKGNQLYGKTLGIIGLGRLGKISARIGKGFGMRIIANDINNIRFKGIELVSLKRDNKIIVYKMRPKKKKRRKMGHRQ